MGDLILVTGANGFVATHVIKILISKGYRVRGTVRKLSDKSKYEQLWTVCGDEARQFLEFAEADLESPPEKWDVAAKDCVACIHSAGPVKLTVEDVQKELLDPILKGVANIFGACERSGTVKRVVFTSSITALSDDFADWKTHVYNGSEWNTKSSPTRNPYAFAKTQGEKAAHEYVKAHPGCFSLACVLPYTVLGPHLIKPSRLPETMDIPMRGALTGKMWLIDYKFGIADVRDTALVHVAAMESLPRDPSAQDPDKIPRYVVWSGLLGYPRILKDIADAIPERKKYLPKHKLPKTLVLLYLKTFMSRGIYQYVKTNSSAAPRFDVSNLKDQLGVELRDSDETIRDCCLWLRDAGYF
jgi:dihydroflavonol-4-reductase